MKIIENLKKHVNKDSQIISRGKWVNVKFVLNVDTSDFIIDIKNGRINSIQLRKVDTESGEFKISSSLNNWKKHWLKIPPRDYHDLFAMLSKKLIKIDGNIISFMQNLQYFKDLIASNRTK